MNTKDLIDTLLEVALDLESVQRKMGHVIQKLEDAPQTVEGTPHGALHANVVELKAVLLTLSEKTLKTFEEMEARTNGKLERLRTFLQNQISAECDGLAARITVLQEEIDASFETAKPPDKEEKTE